MCTLKANFFQIIIKARDAFNFHAVHRLANDSYNCGIEHKEANNCSCCPFVLSILGKDPFATAIKIPEYLTKDED